MNPCCGETAAILPARQRDTLKVVLAINAASFVVMVAAAVYSDSSALLSNSLDNLGDALTYALSLYAVSLGPRAKAQAALFKCGLILFAAIVVLAQIGYRLWQPSLPMFQAMSGFALLNLVANAVCLALLWRHRQEDVNMRSVWECSRNDMADGFAVLVAAIAVLATGAAWPDLVVALGLALLFLRSACRIFSDARETLAANLAEPAGADEQGTSSVRRT
jgi:Co/Zn/Cd efflux system component